MAREENCKTFRVSNVFLCRKRLIEDRRIIKKNFERFADKSNVFFKGVGLGAKL
jgi:hypothetical protein